MDRTARDALSPGYKTIAAAGACATRDLPDHAGNVQAYPITLGVFLGDSIKNWTTHLEARIQH